MESFLNHEGQFFNIDSIPDAFVKCLNTFGRVDIEYIASVTGQDYKTVIEKLQGSIYQNPENGMSVSTRGGKPQKNIYLEM